MTTITAIDNITLTTDQQTALNAFWDFITDPVQTVFVLSGYSGCGKSTLVRVFLEQLPKFEQTMKLVDPAFKPKNVELTATTNKAAENFSLITGMDCTTIHSKLGLRVETDYKTGETKLIANKNITVFNTILFIDEASFIDKSLLEMIFKAVKDCKIIFVGDPAQLSPPKSNKTPVFTAGFSGAALCEVVRQAADNPIIELSTLFRNTVNTGEWFDFKPDGHYIQHLSRENFTKEVEAEFMKPDWKYHDSKILAWTNKRVIEFNHWLTDLKTGTPDFQVGDYAVCNSYLQVGKQSVKTDQTVLITAISPSFERFGISGKNFTLDSRITAFMPDSMDEKNKLLKAARAVKNIEMIQAIEAWVDLRGAYAQTVNKAQGSTYGKVFIDLDDIGKCNNGDLLARMLYVAVSRARDNVYLTGDISA